MLVLGFDTETTGLNVEKDQIIQVGAVLWDTEALTKKAKVKLDILIKGPHISAIDPGALETHGISLEDLDKYGVPFDQAMNEFHKLTAMADFLVCHNGNLFDIPIYRFNCERLGVRPTGRPAIDTSCDIEFPAHITTRKLVYLAAEHGFVNPFPHDAISDVLTMLKIADRYEWKKTVEWARTPTISVRAKVSFAQKELAKKQSYRWDGDSKIWVKSIKEFQLEDARKAATDAGFEIAVHGGKNG